MMISHAENVLIAYVNRLVEQGFITINSDKTRPKYSGTMGEFIDVPIDVQYVVDKLYMGLRINNIDMIHSPAMDHDWGDGTHGRFDSQKLDYKIY